VPSLRDIRRRITSVKKTQQITRAMRMVAAAKLRRAQDRIFAARPYAERMRAAMSEVAGATRDAEHPFLQAREAVKKVEVVVVTSDRGLAGAFSANVLKHAQGLVAEHEDLGRQVTLNLVGRKAIEFFRRRRPGQIGAMRIFGEATLARATEIAQEVSAHFVAREADEVSIVFSEFASALTQAPRHVQLLPFVTAKVLSDAAAAAPFSAEPSLDTLLAALLPKALEVEIFRALLESQAGEFAARMAAMESATRNSEEMIGSLTLRFNRARQAAITRELIEIITGAEAL
jgi:F-type H+-transporting ATPase subunit gamma